MTRSRCFLLMAAALASLVGMSGNAYSGVILTFEGQNNTIYNSPIVRSGFLVGNPAGQEQHFHEITSTDFGLPSNGTGVLLNDRDTQIFIQATDASAFTLTSVDVASALNNLPAVGLTISGFRNGLLTNTITIASLGTGYTTVGGSSLGTVDRLIFDGFGGGGGFVLDNVSLNNGPAVPEPASIALCATSGLILLVYGRSRRRRVNG